MSAILNIKIPFFRRKTSGGSNGVGTFYLGDVPAYLPTLNQICVIKHTNVTAGSGLANKLNTISTNVVTGTFQTYDVLASTTTASITDNYNKFFTIQYDDTTFSINQFAGDCSGYIEYDVSPTTFSIFKPVENVSIVNENVPYDLNDGISELFCATGSTGVFGNTLKPALPGLFVRLQDSNTIFANTLKSLNLPISSEETMKYTQSPLGFLTATDSPSDIVIDGRKYFWTAITGNTTGINLVVHPITGHTGEFYNTVLQSIGSVSDKTNNSLAPYQNQVVLLFEIPQSFYGEVIDGKTMELTLPYWAPTSEPTNGIYTYGSTETLTHIYGTYNRNGNLLDTYFSERDLSLATLGARPDLSAITSYESNTVLLFSNDVQRPKNNQTRDWASGHVEVMDGVKVFDSSATNPKEMYDYNLDKCIGVAYLDKGFIAITHPKIVDSIFTKAFGGTISTVGGVKSYDFNSPATGDVKGLVTTNTNLIKTVNVLGETEWENTQWVFTASEAVTNYKLEYISYNSQKSLNVVCLASADEFYRSTNPTAKELLNLSPLADFADFKSEDANLYPIMITQIGIHDAQGNLLAICKPTQPVKKYWFEVCAFSLKLRL